MSENAKLIYNKHIYININILRALLKSGWDKICFKVFFAVLTQIEENTNEVLINKDYLLKLLKENKFHSYARKNLEKGLLNIDQISFPVFLSIKLKRKNFVFKINPILKEYLKKGNDIDIFVNDIYNLNLKESILLYLLLNSGIKYNQFITQNENSYEYLLNINEEKNIICPTLTSRSYYESIIQKAVMDVYLNASVFKIDSFKSYLIKNQGKIFKIKFTISKDLSEIEDDGPQIYLTEAEKKRLDRNNKIEELLNSGLKQYEVADKLHISLKTVSRFVKSKKKDNFSLTNTENSSIIKYKKKG